MSFTVKKESRVRSYSDRIKPTKEWHLFEEAADFLGQAQRADWTYSQATPRPSTMDRIRALQAWGIQDVYAKTIVGYNDNLRGLMWRTHTANRREWHADESYAKKHHRSKRALAKAQKARRQLERTAGGPTVCFGGRALWRRAQTDPAALEEFKQRRWFMGAIGRSDYTSPKTGNTNRFHGNQMIRLNPGGELSILLPTALLKKHGLTPRTGRVIIGTCVFHYGNDVVQAAISSGHSVSFFIQRQGKYWKLRAQTQLPPVPVKMPVRALGVDVNEGHIDFRRTDLMGNPVGRPKVWRIPSKNVGPLVSKLVHYCKVNHVDVVSIEDLRGLQRRAARANSRAVNGRVGRIPTGRFARGLVAACEDAGIEVRQVDPAGTSRFAPEWFDVSGEVDPTYKHRTSALLIARRGLGLPIQRKQCRRVVRGDSGRHALSFSGSLRDGLGLGMVQDFGEDGSPPF